MRQLFISVGFRTMSPIVPLVNAVTGTRCEVLQTDLLDVYEVEVVDPAEHTAKHVRWIRRQEPVGIRTLTSDRNPTRKGLVSKRAVQNQVQEALGRVLSRLASMAATRQQTALRRIEQIVIESRGSPSLDSPRLNER